jgi:hypothetical protein
VLVQEWEWHTNHIQALPKLLIPLHPGSVRSTHLHPRRLFPAIPKHVMAVLGLHSPQVRRVRLCDGGGE